MEKPKPSQEVPATYTNPEGRIIRVIPEAKKRTVSIDTIGGGWTSHRGVRFSGDLLRNEGRPSLQVPSETIKKRRRRK